MSANPGPANTMGTADVPQEQHGPISAAGGPVILETKPGIYTTEFWTTTLAMILGVIKVSGLVDINLQDKWVVLAMAVIGGLYNVSRGIAKQSVPYRPGLKGR